MKKLVCVIIAFFTVSGVCIGAAGCNDAEKDTINYTATAPVIYYELDDSVKNEYVYKGYEKLIFTEEQDEITQFYKENLSDSNLYLLNYGYELCDANFHYYNVYRGTGNNKLFARMNFSLFDKELGVWAPQNKPSGVNISLEFCMFIIPTESKAENGFKLEFGKSKDKIYGYDKYVNVYNSEECFATCYFDRGEISIKEEWFENYFANNLVWGGDL